MKTNQFIDYLTELVDTFNTNIKNKAVFMNVENRACFSVQPGSSVFNRNQPHEILCVQAFLSGDPKKPYFLDLRFRPDPEQYVPEPFEIIELKFDKDKLNQFIKEKEDNGYKFSIDKMKVAEDIESLRLVANDKVNNTIYIGIESDFLQPVFAAVPIQRKDF